MLWLACAHVKQAKFTSKLLYVQHALVVSYDFVVKACVAQAGLCSALLHIGLSCNGQRFTFQLQYNKNYCDVIGSGC